MVCGQSWLHEPAQLTSQEGSFREFVDLIGAGLVKTLKCRPRVHPDCGVESVVSGVNWGIYTQS